MKPLVDIEISNHCNLPHWESACKIWLNSIALFCKNFEYTDSPWEYLERTNSSIFAGALTASGIPSMPETYVMRDNRKEQKNQRVDICCIHSNKMIELVEFKMVEYDATFPITGKRIDSKIKEAISQVNNITGIHGTEILVSNINITRTVAVIGLPYFPINTEKSIMQDNIQKIIKELQDSNHDIKAWIFPPEYLKNESIRYKGKYYMGTFVVAKSV